MRTVIAVLVAGGLLAAGYAQDDGQGAKKPKDDKPAAKKPKADKPAVGAAADPKPSQGCDAPFGWWESRGLQPLFVDKNSGPPTTDCDFQVWSWTAFVHWTVTDPATGQPRFLGLPTPADLSAGPENAKAAPGPRPLVLAPRVPKRDDLSEITQAGSHGVVVDANQRAVYYSVHMDPLYFATAAKFYGRAKYEAASPTAQFPLGATVFKASWQVLPPGIQPPANVFTTKASIAELDNGPDGRLKITGKFIADQTVALLGLHVVGVIKDHPEFAWGTFEHMGTAPDLPPGVGPKSPRPVSRQPYPLYKANTPAMDCNVICNLQVDKATQKVTPPTNVFRQFAFGGAEKDRENDIKSANKNFQAAIRGGAGGVKPVWANYRLIGTVWEEANTLVPGNENMDQTAIGSPDLANATMETFVQGKGTNCFSCHNTAGGSFKQDGYTYVGKDLNLSHVVLGGIAPRSKGD